ncbi:MAG: hypothetical protein M1812_005251 [Candelaria pacifica]|nr:MAG: hypothetical protein M1812_005251 [Candelaria pacifica]
MPYSMYFLSNSIPIGLILFQVLLASASPLTQPLVGSLAKRNYVLQCDNDTIPYGGGDFEGFTSLTDLCIGYPYGAGFTCSETGERGLRAPLSIIARYISEYAPEIIRNGCSECLCFNIAPETPELNVPALASPFSGNPGQSTTDAATGDGSSSTADQSSPSKRVRVCSSPVTCTDPAVNYICNWKAANIAKVVLEVIYGSASAIINNHLATCVAE